MKTRILFLAALVAVCHMSVSAQDPVYGTAQRPDPGREPVPVNTSGGDSYRFKMLDYCRAASIEITGSGRIWMAAVSGGDNADGFVVLSYSDTRGKSWSETAGVIDPHDSSLAEKRSAYSPVLWRSPSGELWLFYTVSMGYFDGRGSLWVTVCSNPDADKPEWSAPSYLGYGVCSAKPLVLNNGRWAFPAALWGRDVIDCHVDSYKAPVGEGHRISSPYADAYHELDSERGAGVYLSNDKGTTWIPYLGVAVPEKVKARYNDPSLIVRNNGELMMLSRSCGTAWCYASISKDWGKNWQSQWKFIPHSDARISVSRLSDGKWLMVRNGRFDQTIYARQAGIYAYLSDDGGATWYGGLQIDDRVGAIDPSVCQSADGTIYVLYTYEPSKSGEIRLATTSIGEIDAACSDPETTAAQVRTVLVAGRAAATEAAAMKRLTASKKNWASETLRIGTYNIQYKNSRWETERLPALKAQMIPLFDFDLLGVQEPTLEQIEDMMEFMGGEYDWVGTCITGRNTDRTSHFNMIFYRKNRLEVLDWDTVWFSEKPATAGFGAYSPRLCVWVRFRDKQTDKEFYLFNSHFDHIGPEAKLMSAYILVDTVREIAKGMPAFMTGDFNSDESSQPYQTIIESGFIDDSLLAVSEPVNAEYFSMANYKVSNLRKTNKHIDHVFYTPSSVRIMNWHMYIDDFNGKFGSDHLPIIIECRIAN